MGRHSADQEQGLCVPGWLVMTACMIARDVCTSRHESIVVQHSMHVGRFD